MQVVQTVRFSSALSYEEAVQVAHERQKQFLEVPGLIQKYYVRLDSGDFMGVYLWESREALMKYRDSDLAKTIPEAYKVLGKPEIFVGPVMFTLR